MPWAGRPIAPPGVISRDRIGRPGSSRSAGRRDQDRPATAPLHGPSHRRAGRSRPPRALDRGCRCAAEARCELEACTEVRLTCGRSPASRYAWARSSWASATSSTSSGWLSRRRWRSCTPSLRASRFLDWRRVNALIRRYWARFARRAFASLVSNSSWALAGQASERNQSSLGICSPALLTRASPRPSCGRFRRATDSGGHCCYVPPIVAGRQGQEMVRHELGPRQHRCWSGALFGGRPRQDPNLRTRPRRVVRCSGSSALDLDVRWRVELDANGRQRVFSATSIARVRPGG